MSTSQSDNKMSDTVLYSVADHVATITMNRPERHNALNHESYAATTDAFNKANADQQVRCIIFTGAGRSFCSGDDVVEIMASGDGLKGALKKPEAKDTPATTNPPLAVAMRTSRCPIIAAVNGVAVGFGMELTLLADIRVASETARFSEMFVRRGIIATHISYDLLPNIVGPAMAAEMLLTGEMINAEKALACGLVSEITEPDALLTHADKLAAAIAENPPLAVQRAKVGLAMKRDHQLAELDHYLSLSLSDLSRTKDHQESVAAFLEKRAGKYIGE